MYGFLTRSYSFERVPYLGRTICYILLLSLAMRPWAYAFSQYALGALGRMIYTSLPFVTCLPLSPSTLLSPWVQQAA